MSRKVTPNALFVYGTLMRGESNHGRVSSARRIEPASTSGRLVDLPHGYPAMLDGDGTVFGELVVFDDLDRVLPELDRYEDYDPNDPTGSLYQRVVSEVTTESGEKVEAWCYVMVEAPRGAAPVPSGRWRAR